MNAIELGQFKESLLVRRAKLAGGSAITEIEPNQAEIIDIAQALEQIEREKSLQEAERREWLAIERALAKINAGHFGVCEDCEEEIPSRRLRIVPEARLCAQCQEFEERVNGRGVVRPNRVAA